jgi:hypothetical protein
MTLPVSKRGQSDVRKNIISGFYRLVRKYTTGFRQKFAKVFEFAKMPVEYAGLPSENDDIFHQSPSLQNISSCLIQKSYKIKSLKKINIP